MELEEEKNKYGDILQLSIEDSYENLAYKSLASFAWLWKQYGKNLQWIIKIDDDLDLKVALSQKDFRFWPEKLSSSILQQNICSGVEFSFDI